MRKRDLGLAYLATVVAFLAVGAYHNYPAVTRTLRLVSELRESGLRQEYPVTPYVLLGIRIVLFYPLAALLTAAALGLTAWLMAFPAPRKGAENTPAFAPSTLLGASAGKPADGRRVRRRFHLAYLLLLTGFLLYIYLRMLTLHPALFARSYRYAWFAGSPTWAGIVATVGWAAPLVIAAVLLLKFRVSIAAAHRNPRVKKTAAVVVGLALLAVIGAGMLKIVQGSGFRNQGPNIIFLGLESVRPDHISALGYGRETTPALDAFLKDAVAFEQAFVPIARTYPSWMAVLTACNPPTNGVRFNLPPPDMYLLQVPTVAQHLRPHGYFTAVMHDTSYAWFEPQQGFDLISQPDHSAVAFYRSFAQAGAVLDYYFLNNRLGFLYDSTLRNSAAFTAIYRPELFAGDVVGHFRAMRKRERFLTFLHLSVIHVPYSVSYPYSTYFAPVRQSHGGPITNRFTFGIEVEKLARRDSAGKPLTAAQARRIFAQETNLYDALLRSTDDCVRQILDGLKHAGLYDNSAIVVYSDHGENLYETGRRDTYRFANHGDHMWGDTDKRMLLAVKFPGQKYAGRRVKRLVRSIDIVPTLLDVLGLPPMPEAEGVSVKPCIENPDADMQLVAYGETGLILDDFYVPDHLDYSFGSHFELHVVKDQRIYKNPQFTANLVLAKDRMARDERWKLIVYPVVRAPDDSPTSAGESNAPPRPQLGFRSELFDVVADPKNRTDLSAQHPEVVARLRKHLWPYIQSDWERWGRQLIIPNAEPVASDVGKK